MPTGYFEDVTIGATFQAGSKTVSEEEIISFATKYDPQPFHIDKEAAKDSPYGGIIASGWHTAGMAMRLMVDHIIDLEVGLGSPGWNNMRWHLPVRPNDSLRVELKIVDKKQSRTRPAMGTIFGKLIVINQKDEMVMSVDTIGMVKTKTASTV
ncbi:MAG: MaoC family dehydratase [Sneathiellales bacterium]|nr:MaoC family dehydratase [Sneathiellales bacterium]